MPGPAFRDTERPRGATELRTSPRRDPRAEPATDRPSPSPQEARATGVQRPPREEPSRVNAREEPSRVNVREEPPRAPVREAQAPNPAVEALEARVARLDEALVEAKRETETARDAAKENTARLEAELERAVAGMARLQTSFDDLAAKLQSERDERLTAAQGDRARLDAVLEQLRRLEDDVSARAAVPAPMPVPVAKPAAPELKPRVASTATTGRRELPQGDIPLFRVPAQDYSRPSALKRFVIKFAILGAIGGTVAVTQREQIAKVADKMVNTPKQAATETGMSNVVAMLRADFVDKPMPKPSEFSAYLKSRAVGNVDKAPIDGWGTELRLEASPVAVRSAGPDKAFDTPDDIVMELEAAK